VEQDEKLSQIAEDVAYIKGRIEVFPVLEERVRTLEKRVWGVPAGLLAAVLATVGIQYTGGA
jgi:hypothetical protein